MSPVFLSHALCVSSCFSPTMKILPAFLRAGKSEVPSCLHARSILAGISTAIALAFAVATVKAAPVLPTDNTAAPYMGLYGWGLSGTNNISHIHTTASWLYRSSLWAEDFLATDSWTNLEGPGWALAPAQSWLRANPGAKYILTVGMLPSSPTGCTLAQGATGTYNSHFQTLAQNLVSRGLADSTIIRLGHEFNGGWYTWKVASQADAFNYAAYWQQVVNTMRAVPGAGNIKFVWNGSCTTWTSYSVADAYPGDAYVDYVGVDIYDQSWAANTYPYPSGATPAQILAAQQNAWAANSGTANNGLAVWKNIAVAHSKPLTIPEWGVCQRTDGHGGLDDTYYVQQMYNFIEDPANNVYFHVYFDASPGDGAHQLTQLPGGSATLFPNSAALFRKLFGVNPLPVNTDIGTTGLAGSSDPVTVSGGGAGYLTGTSDSFHFAARATEGDDRFIARIPSMSADPAAQSGVMFRQSAGAGSPYAALFMSNGQCIFQGRAIAGATAVCTATISATTAPASLKLVRQGNLITGYLSMDGINWTVVGRQNVTMTSAAFVGVAVSSGNTTALNTTATDMVDNFDIVAVDPGIADEIIVDSAATTGVTRTGSWTVSGTNAKAYGGTTLTAWAPATASTLTFSPTLSTAGQYDVYVRWLASYQMGDHTNISVTSADGTWAGLVNQETDDQTWLFLGTYHFNAGTAGNVILNNTSPGGYGYVTADATMFVKVPEPSLPAPKTDADVGSPSLAGSASYSGGVYTVQGCGNGLWGTADQFHYVSQPLSGDQTLIARITGLTNTNSSATAGVMIRNTLAAGSPYFMTSVTPSGVVICRMRVTADASAGSTYNSVATGIVPSSATPIWVKVVKVGSNFYGYYATTIGTPLSTDWHSVSSTWISAISSGYLGGLNVSSNSSTALTIATFDNVTP
jgi:hypothetical protein